MSLHIGAKPGDIAESILLPGDPRRAKYIADTFFENPVKFNDVRGMWGFTGTYKGKRVSAMGTGMGIPSISIYANELIREYGVKNLIRVGTCGAMQDHVGLKDGVLGMGACTDNDFNHHVFKGIYCPTADFELIRAAYYTAKETGVDVKVGNISSGDMFYGEHDEKSDRFTEYGVLAGEMEGAALYTIAAREHVRALTILTVTDHPSGNLTPEERELTLNTMLQLALDTVIKFQD